MSCANYLKPALRLEDRRECVDSIVKELQDIQNRDGKINFIAVIGVSGLLIGPIISYLTNIPLVVVRSNDNKSHSARTVEYDSSINSFRTKKYVIIDDLVDSGATLERIGAEIDESFPKAKCLGILFYSRLFWMTDEKIRNTVKAVKSIRFFHNVPHIMIPNNCTEE